jgi:chromosome segregation ATPase
VPLISKGRAEAEDRLDPRDEDERDRGDRDRELDDATYNQLKKILEHIYKVIQKQNESMYELKNGCIRLENNIKMVEDKLSQYVAYKELCETILNKINNNPIGALCFLYKVKHKIDKYNEC